MLGKAYDFHRLSGRMTMDHRQRMSNKAEVGMGMFSVVGLVIVLAIFLAVIGVI